MQFYLQKEAQLKTILSWPPLNYRSHCEADAERSPRWYLVQFSAPPTRSSLQPPQMNCSSDVPPGGVTPSSSLYMGYAWVGFPPQGCIFKAEACSCICIFSAKHRCPVHVCGIQCFDKSCAPASSFHFIGARSALLRSSSISQSKELTRIPWGFKVVAAWPQIVRATWKEEIFFLGEDNWSSSLRNK